MLMTMIEDVTTPGVKKNNLERILGRALENGIDSAIWSELYFSP